MLLDGLVELGTVDAVGRAELLCHLEFARIDVDGDDATGTCHLGALDHGKSDCSKAKHSYRGIHLNLTGVPDCSESSGDATAKETGLVKRCFLRNDSAADLGKDRVSIGIVNDAKYNNNINEK